MADSIPVPGWRLLLDLPQRLGGFAANVGEVIEPGALAHFSIRLAQEQARLALARTR